MKPRKKRNVMYPPGTFYFKPQGVPASYLSIINLTIDEYEAVRLGDFENLKHEQAALRMNISRPTFTRLIESAHAKISDAIVNGKAISIEGGDYRFIGNRLRCRRCGSNWNIEEKTAGKDASCPECSSDDIDNIGENLSSIKHSQGRGRYGPGPLRPR